MTSPNTGWTVENCANLICLNNKELDVEIVLVKAHVQSVARAKNRLTVMLVNGEPNVIDFDDVKAANSVKQQLTEALYVSDLV